MGDAAVPIEAVPLNPAAIPALLELAPDGIFVADFEGKLTYVNAAGCAMVGYRCDELIGRKIVEFVPPDEVERLTRSKAAMVEGRSDAAEWLLRRKDGSWLPVEVNANIVADGQWQGFARDISSRKAQQAEREALFEQMDRDRRWLRAVMNQMPLGAILFEVDGKITFNERAEQLLGMKLSPGGGTEQYAGRFFYPDGRPVPHEEFPSTRVLSGGEALTAAEYVIRRPDGTEIPIFGSAAPIVDSDGRLLGGVGVFQDVSERVGLERAVRENEHLLKAVFDLLPVGVWIADRSGRIARNNPAAQNVWHGARYVPVEEFGAYKGWWLDSGKPIAADEWALARALTKGETSIGELVRIECFDGTTKTIINSAAPLRDDKGDIAGAIVVNEDITALHEAQEKLRASESLLRTVFQLLPVGLWIADRGGKIVLGNAAGKRIWEGVRHVGPYQYSEYQGWWVDTGLPIAEDEWGIARAVGRGETSRSDLIRIKCFDGSLKTIINWAAPIRGEAGEITGAVAVNEDVTALHQTQEQLRAAVRDREHILAVVAHDLRNPLSGIMLRAAYAEQKARMIPGAEELCSSAASIGETTRAMAGLVEDLLAISAARSGRSMLDFLPVPPGEVLAKAAEAAQPLLARAGLQLVVEPVPGELPLIHIDLNRILRVFTNLLDNVVKFTESKGRVVMRVELAEGAVKFSVANSGPALRAEEMGRLFQPFWQAGREDRRGTGLGLSICRSIIEAHDGRIWAEPAAGMRVKVCFMLPCIKLAAAGVCPAKAAGLPLGLEGAGSS
jgi:PAS domain S-box-containing protein